MWRLKVDQQACGLCDLCALACSTEKYGVQNPHMSAIKVNHRSAPTKGRDTGAVDVLPCWHCENPPCYSACPFDAMLLSDDNVVSIIYEQPPEGHSICTSCMRCVRACEEMHGVSSIFISPTKDRPMTTKSGREVDKVTLYKCDCCDGQPKCVEICPRDAIEFIQT